MSMIFGLVVGLHLVGVVFDGVYIVLRLQIGSGNEGTKS